MGRWPRRPAMVAVAGVAVLVVVLATVWPYLPRAAEPPSPSIVVRDNTPDLGPVFQPGIILSGASNGSVTLLGGIGYYVHTPEFSLPVLAELSAGPAGIRVLNLTADVAGYFFDGGVYGVGWNGSDWLIGGQASWGGGNYGTLVSWDGASIENLTGELGGAFDGGGIFALASNGSGWLVGGNSSSGPVLLSLEGSRVDDLTARMTTYDRLGWIQALDWNGTTWVVGGEGVLGTLEGDRFSDLWPQSPYGGQGAYAAGWNGSAWLIGGGSARLTLLRGGHLFPGPVLPRAFDQSALLVAPLASGWLLGGKGTGPGGGIAPELVYWSGGAQQFVDLGGSVPPSFAGGEIQGGVAGPAETPRSILLVGEGDYSPATGHGLGSVATLTWSE